LNRRMAIKWDIHFPNNSLLKLELKINFVEFR
jgi:hypothetical protein